MIPIKMMWHFQNIHFYLMLIMHSENCQCAIGVLVCVSQK